MRDAAQEFQGRRSKLLNGSDANLSQSFRRGRAYSWNHACFSYFPPRDFGPAASAQLNNCESPHSFVVVMVCRIHYESSAHLLLLSSAPVGVAAYDERDVVGTL